MKKSLTLLTSVLLVLFLSFSAFAESIDLSSMSYDELLSLQNRIVKEIQTRPEYKVVKVPTGVYKVGEDIPVGKWTITATEGATTVYWGKALDEYGVEVPWSDRIDTLDDWGSGSSVTWDLVKGTYIVVTLKGVTFSPYVPTSLGF